MIFFRFICLHPGNYIPLQNQFNSNEMMRSRTADWFETKIRYEKTMEDGSMKAVTESYVVDALSFTEAEASITEEMSMYISGDFKITGIKTVTMIVGIGLNYNLSQLMRSPKKRNVPISII